MMGCDGACAAGFDLVFIGLPLLSLYEIPMLIWFIWRAFLQLRWSLRCSFGCRPGMLRCSFGCRPWYAWTS